MDNRQTQPRKQTRPRPTRFPWRAAVYLTADTGAAVDRLAGFGGRAGRSAAPGDRIRPAAGQGSAAGEGAPRPDGMSADDDVEDLAAFKAANANAPAVRTDWTAPAPAREWLIPEWLPASRVCLLSGPGAVGKSRLALQLAVAIACGDPVWLKRGPRLTLPNVAVARPHHDPRIKKGDQGAVAVIASWEDEPDELARRMAGYVPVPDPDDRLVALDLSGGGPLWASKSPGAPAAWTDSGKWVMNYTGGRDARLLVIDSAAAAFGGNENSRSEVRAFVSALDAWACSARCAVLLISHPSKASEGEAAIYSGSTDWRNSVRALWELRAVPISWNSKRSAVRLRNEKASYGLDGAVLWLGGYPQWLGMSPTDAATDYERAHPQEASWEPIP